MKTSMVSLLLCGSIALQAQSKFGFGISLFPHISTPMVSEVFSEHSSSASQFTGDVKYYNAGGFMINYFIWDHFTFTSGLNILQSGYTESQDIHMGTWDPTLPVKFESTYKFTYLELPALLNCYLKSSTATGLFFTIGPEFGLPLESDVFTIITNGDGTVVNETLDNELDDNIRIPSVALDAGIGYRVKLIDKLTLAVQPFIQYNLTNVYKANYRKVNLLNSGIHIDLLFQ